MPADVIAFLLFPAAVLSAWYFLDKVRRRRWHPALLIVLLPIGCEGLAVRSALCIRDDWQGVETFVRFTREDLVGVWGAGDRKLQLMADGRFVREGSTGSWSIDEHLSEIRTGDLTWVVWKKNGELVLLPEQQVSRERDPDEWNLHGMYRRDPSGAPADAGFKP